MTLQSPSQLNVVSAETDEATLRQELQAALQGFEEATHNGLTDLAGSRITRAGVIKMLLAQKRVED